MQIIELISGSLLLIFLGVGLIILGITALVSPQKIVNYNLNSVKKLRYLNYFKRLKDNYITKAENGYYAQSWRKSGLILILVGLIHLYALISYWINYSK